jgi:phage gp36-like protein
MYCSIDDLKEAKDFRSIIQLSNDSGNPQEADENIVNQNIKKAGNVIDTYLAGRYLTPINGEVPGIIRDICVDLTVFNLYTRRNREIPKESGVFLDYQAAIKTLEKIADKKINLSGIAEINQSGTNSRNGIIKTNKSKADRFFNSYRMRGYNGTQWN